MINRVFLKMTLLCLVFSLCWGGCVSSVFAAEHQEVSASTAFGDTILKKGAKGGDVYELQGRLKLLGFYTGDVDGVFGHRTYLAVRLFQYEFGLKIDGVVGPKTKLKLWQSTKHWRPEMTNRKASGTQLKRGNMGGGVWELQGRLKHIGFYTGKVDGNFGERTYRAVRLFQYEFGLKVDGVAGPKTIQKLRQATKNYAPDTQKPQESKQVSIPKSSYGLSQNDIHLLAQAVYAEGRGESYIGQVAIAAVILNRLESREFPDTISGIIFQPLAFEAVADGQIWMQPDETAKKAVRDALNGWDPSGGALYYFNPERATSKWIWSRPQIKKIGKHIFTR